ncbi:hypothetical protein, partial [Streptomyces sp. SID3343]|uniref:hypothetical protein n=1 Tax=Streptomyces sp. SID3343 TaxID=2690260 RepID=UPI001F3935CA
MAFLPQQHHRISRSSIAFIRDDFGYLLFLCMWFGKFQSVRAWQKRVTESAKLEEPEAEEAKASRRKAKD